MKAKRNRLFVKRRLGRYGFLLAGIIYIVGMLLGFAVTVCVPFFNHRSDLLRIAESRGNYSMTHDASYPNPTFGMEYHLIREDGQTVISDQVFLSAKDRESLRDFLPELFEKERIYTIKRYALGNAGRKSGEVLCIVAGVIVKDASGFLYGSFSIRDLNDLDISLETFAGLYTLIFATALFLLVTISKQHAELMQLQRDLVSNVSHELKTPITSIKAIAELIQDGMYKTDEDLRHYISSIVDETDRLKDSVKEILELSQLQNHKVELKKTKCSALGVFEPVVDRYKMLCVDLGIELDTSGLDLAGIPALYTDAKHISRVMNILLENAVKFVGAGGRIALSAQSQAHHAVFCVKDNGPGIDSADIDRIFERFYKADVTHNSQGSGLGLSIASETIKGLGEKIWVESIRGEGSAFFFTVGYK